MPFLSWRKDYEVDVPQIDGEHRGLFDLVNEYHDTCGRTNSRKESARVLNRLVAYAEEHFQHEEELMNEYGYPLLDAHRRQHSDLVLAVFAINEKLAADAARASVEILPFMRNWLVEHIVRSDMDIGDFLRRRTDPGKTPQGACAAQAERN